MTVGPLSAAGFHVICPGSTSNLGSGFDTLGMAVDRYLTLHLRPASDREQVSGLTLERRGTLADLPDDTDGPGGDLIVSTLMNRLGRIPCPMILIADSDIPIGRGLGSSASARVAGEVLAALVAGGEVDRVAVMAAATADEGHPDNVAPTVFGGLVAAGMRGGLASDSPTGLPQPDVRRLLLSPAIGWGYSAPATQVATRESRAALPDSWPRDLVARSLSRLARLIPALGDPGADGEHLRGLLDDELHVPHRLPLIPGAAEAVVAAREAGAWGVTLSGAGSGLIALGPTRGMGPIVMAMSAAFATTQPTDGTPDAFVLHPEFQGVRWGEGTPPDLNSLRPVPIRLA